MSLTLQIETVKEEEDKEEVGRCVSLPCYRRREKEKKKKVDKCVSL